MTIDLPKEFFNITFLPQERFYPATFHQADYRVIGEDDVGNLIGEAEDGMVCLLNTGEEEEHPLVYLAKNRETLAQAIDTYRRHREKSALSDDSDEAEFAEDANALAEQLAALDPEMLRDEFTFWSPLLEEMSYGMI